MSIFDIHAKESSRYSGEVYSKSSSACVARSRQEAISFQYGVQLSLQDTLFANGGTQKDAAIQQIGYELGVNKNLGDDNLSFDRYVSSSNSQDDMLFQGEDGMLYNVDFVNGSLTSESVEEFAVEHSLIDEETGAKGYEVVAFGKNKAEFIEYQFDGLEDGVQNKFEMQVADDKWSTVNQVYQEVDASLFGSTAGGVEPGKANDAYYKIIKNANQWLTASDYTTLAEATTTSEYKQMLVNLAIKNLHQGQVAGKDNNINYGTTVTDNNDTSGENGEADENGENGEDDYNIYT